MGTPGDPTSPTYVDEKSTRDELTRVFDVCRTCRRCTDLCGAFPALFEAIDAMPDGDAGRLTPAQQDTVVDACFQCGACRDICPYAPGRHAAGVDVPRLVLRAMAMRSARGQLPPSDRRAIAVLGRTDLVGRWGTRLAPLANPVVAARNGSFVRRVTATLTGVSAFRTLPRFTSRRFSRWWRARASTGREGRDRAIVFPTCLVEYHDPQIGIDLVEAIEARGVACRVATTGCCGAPLLHAGKIDRFARVVGRRVRELSAASSADEPIVVPQRTCAVVLRDHAPEHVAPEVRAEADRVASRVVGASAYVGRLRGRLTADDGPVDGPVDERPVTHHVQADGAASEVSELFAGLGVRTTIVRVAAGITSAWGLRRSHDAAAEGCAAGLAERLRDPTGGAGEVTGEDSLANRMIGDRAGRIAHHPVQLPAVHRGQQPPAR